jgi:hypothetical protein
MMPPTAPPAPSPWTYQRPKGTTFDVTQAYDDNVVDFMQSALTQALAHTPDSDESTD